MIKVFFKKVKLKLLIVSARKFGFRAFGSHHVYFEKFNENSTVVDIGGNKGEFLRAIKSKIDCNYFFVEVDKSLFAHLPFYQKLVKSNVAISNKNEILIFYLSNNSEANSFNEIIASKYGVREKIEVHTQSLEYYCTSNNIEIVDLLKMDVEGAEIDIFENSKDEFLKKVKQVTVEFHEIYDANLLDPTIKCINRFKNIGFIPVIFYNDTFEDVVFLNSRDFKFSISQKFWLKVYQMLQYNPKPGKL